MPAPGERVALIVIRAWLEADTEDVGLRVRLSATNDLMGGQAPTTVAAADVDAVCALVQRWLLEFVEAADLPGRSTPEGEPR
jgi:hypothetical protein